MKTPRALYIALTLIILHTIPAIAQDEDIAPWVGREPKDLPTLLKNFGNSCERKYLPRIEKYKKPYDVAQAWTRDHCQCVVRFFESKADPLYVQVVNLEVRGALKNMPALPPELEIYLDHYEMVRQDCERDPNYIPNPKAKETNKPVEGNVRDSKSKAKIPYRPQKGVLPKKSDSTGESRR